MSEIYDSDLNDIENAIVGFNMRREQSMNDELAVQLRLYNAQNGKTALQRRIEPFDFVKQDLTDNEEADRALKAYEKIMSKYENRG